jgi:hypothetical protein
MGKPNSVKTGHKIKSAYWLLGIVVAAVLMVMSSKSSQAAVSVDPPPPAPEMKIYVATNGSDFQNGSSPMTSVRSVKRAIALGANKIIFVGPTYELPLALEHKQSGGLVLKKSVLLVSNQTPWEEAPSSSKGGYTEILPARNLDGTVNIDYRFLKLRPASNYSIGGQGNSMVVKFLKFQNTELWGDGLNVVRYQGD